MNTEKIIKKIDDSYGIDITKIELLRDGSDNIIWDATSSNSNKYAIRVSKRDMGDDIAFEAGWISTLQKEGVPVVPIVLTKHGESHTHFPDGQAVTVFNFLEGKHFSVSIDKPLPRHVVEAAAEALATLHGVSKRCEVNESRKRTVFSELERVVDHQNLILEKTPGGKEFIIEVRDMLGWGKAQIFDSVLVHNDYRISNIMFDDKDNLLAILDFDWSCMGPAIKDVAHSLAEWSFPDGAEKHDEAVFSTFLAKYNKSSKSPVPRDSILYRWIALSCLSDASTFLMDRLLKGEIKQPSYSYMYKKYQYFLAMK